MRHREYSTAKLGKQNSNWDELRSIAKNGFPCQAFSGGIAFRLWVVFCQLHSQPLYHRRYDRRFNRLILARLNG